MWPALMIRSLSLKFLLLSLVLAQRQISSLLNIFFPHKSFSHLCCNVKIPRLVKAFCIFCDITCMSYILCSIPIDSVGNILSKKGECMMGAMIPAISKFFSRSRRLLVSIHDRIRKIEIVQKGNSQCSLEVLRNHLHGLLTRR